MTSPRNELSMPTVVGLDTAIAATQEPLFSFSFL
jgi:hypothetical protein